MCFRRKHTSDTPVKVTSVILRQLQTEEIDKNYSGITRFGAAYSIKFKEKEDTSMVEKLRAYRDELLAKIEEIKGADHTAEVEAKTAEFRANLVATIEAEADKAILKLNSDIDCINGLIEREEAAAAAVVEAETVPDVDAVAVSIE